MTQEEEAWRLYLENVAVVKDFAARFTRRDSFEFEQLVDIGADIYVATYQATEFTSLAAFHREVVKQMKRPFATFARRQRRHAATLHALARFEQGGVMPLSTADQHPQQLDVTHVEITEALARLRARLPAYQRPVFDRLIRGDSVVQIAADTGYKKTMIYKLRGELKTWLADQ